MYPEKKNLIENNEAVSEIIGEILLTGIAVIAFSVIAVFLLSPQEIGRASCRERV